MKVLSDLHLNSIVSFSVTLEIIAKAHCLGYKIVEVPTVWNDRQIGNSNFKIFRSIPAYLKWFCLSLLKNRLFAFPNAWFRYWFCVNKNKSFISNK